MVLIPIAREEWGNAAAIAFDRASKKIPGKGKIQSRKEGLLHCATIGALGEIAFSQMTGLPVDRNIYVGGDKYDFISNGMTVNVKTREWSGEKLEMHLFPDEPKKVDLFVLFRIGDDPKHIEFIGHIFSKDIIENYKPDLHDHLYGRKILVPREAFSDPKETLALFRGGVDQTSHKDQVVSRN
jgi:hypothetical protein